jgi:hypothetical protein
MTATTSHHNAVCGGSVASLIPRAPPRAVVAATRLPTSPPAKHRPATPGRRHAATPMVRVRWDLIQLEVHVGGTAGLRLD